MKIIPQATFVTLIHAAFAATILLNTTAPAKASPTSLGEAFNFGVLAGSTVTNTGVSTVYGNVGVTSSTDISGISPEMIIAGTKHQNTVNAQQAQSDLFAAHNALAAEAATGSLTGTDLGGLTLAPGVYRFDSSAQLTGLLILDAQNDPGARFAFQIGSTLTTASASEVRLRNGAQAGNVFWQVGSSATLGTNTVFTGNVLALESITLTTGVSALGARFLAHNGAVTIDAARVGFAIVPETGTIALFGLLGLPIVTICEIARRRNRFNVRE